MKLTPFQAKCASMIQQCRLAPGIPTVWLPISTVMAHIRIESGFVADIKASDFAKTGSVGLMQVTAETAKEVIAKYPNAGLVLPQTDPYTSIVTGMLYLRMCYDYLLPIFGAPLAYKHVCEAFHEGPGNAGKSVNDDAYYYKWRAAQADYAMLDYSVMVSAAIPAPQSFGFHDYHGHKEGR